VGGAEDAVEIGSWRPRRGGVWVCEWDSRGVCVGGGCESSVVLMDIGEGGVTRPPRVFPTPVSSDVISLVFLSDPGGATNSPTNSKLFKHGNTNFVCK
jgi:hypothetical protein